MLGGPLSKIVIRLETGAGVVPVELERDGPKIVFGLMEQPLPNWEAVADPGPIFAAVGVEGSGLPVEYYDLGPGHLYIELSSPDEVAGLTPNAQALAAATGAGVNCFARDGARWKTRMFAPDHGVIEDAATGSAAGPLAVHLARHGRIAWGERIEISQGAEIGRPSTLYAEAYGGPERLSSGSRSAAPRWSSRAASSCSRTTPRGSPAAPPAARSRRRRRPATGTADCGLRRAHGPDRPDRRQRRAPRAARVPSRAT